MATRREFLREIWESTIDSNLGKEWIPRFVEECKQRPDRPFADAGLALQRCLASGVAPEDLAAFARFVSYDTAFSLLYMLEDPGVDDAGMLHEELLGADPSGREGRPEGQP